MWGTPRVPWPIATIGIVSYRLGGTDGVSIEAATWASALRRLGHGVRTVAASGADVLVPGLAIEATRPPGAEQLEESLDGCSLVIAENICSLPLNPEASAAVARALTGRPAVLRHHDLPWQRTATHDFGVPDDPAWRHVVATERNRGELAERGVDVTVIANAFDTDAPLGDARAGRAHAGIGSRGTVVLQPTRAIARKNVPAGIALAEALDATYWITGAAEEGYGPELDRLLAQASVPTVHRSIAAVADAYAAADLVVLPSTEEGFGNPAVESAVHRRPLAIGAYRVADELRRFGFRWFALEDIDAIRAFVAAPDAAVLDHNACVARDHFGLDRLDRQLSRLLEDFGL